MEIKKKEQEFKNPKEALDFFIILLGKTLYIDRFLDWLHKLEQNKRTRIFAYLILTVLGFLPLIIVLIGELLK